LEQPAREAAAFFYQTPIEFAGVTVRRNSYEVLSGFRADVGFVSDCEMWARIIGCHGGIVSTGVKAFHRLYHGNETARLSRTAEGVRDICRLNELFDRRFAAFSMEKGRARASALAWSQYKMFKDLGDETGATANWNTWVELTPGIQRIAVRIGSRAMPYIRRRVFGERA
jgi:hypothetical protein